MSGMVALLGLILLPNFPGDEFYNVARETTLTGEIVGVDTLQGQSVIRLRTRESDTLLMAVGPALLFMDSLDRWMGAPVTAVASPGRHLWILRELRFVRDTVTLRSPEGFPLWIRPRPTVPDPPDPRVPEDTFQARIYRLEITQPPRGIFPILTAWVVTDHGDTMEVLLGPEWVLREHVRVGDTLTIHGWVFSDRTHPLLLASEIAREGTRIPLRSPDGEPLWGDLPFPNGPPAAMPDSVPWDLPTTPGPP